MSRIPHLVSNHGRTELRVNNSPFFMFGGELHNSSSSSAEYMTSQVWPRIEELRCNTILAPVSWELVEPEEGIFDFSLLQSLIEQAEARDVKLIILWFGSWKNGWSTYAPGWVRKDVERFARAENQPGTRCGALSPFSEANRVADTKAFCAMMTYLTEHDPNFTVITVQIQNEMGILNGRRDYSGLAEEQYQQGVPQELLEYLAEHRETLHPTLQVFLTGDEGGWEDVFGDRGDELFMAYHYATYVEHMTAEGQTIHNLPMFVNAWLHNVDFKHPQGGPVAYTKDVWRFVAPSIFTCAPDNYCEDFASVCRDYAFPDNPLLIPEMRRNLSAPAAILYAFGQHQALGIAPFGIESTGGMAKSTAPDDLGNPVDTWNWQANQDHPQAKPLLARTYELLTQASPLLTEYLFPESSCGFLQDSESEAKLDFSGYTVQIKYPSSPGDKDLQVAFPGGGNLSIPKNTEPLPKGGGMILRLAEDEFLVIGIACFVSFRNPEGHLHTEWEWHEEGQFVDGKWKARRRLNGDEAVMRFGPMPEIRRVKLMSWPLAT